jgi:hypothetical protein
MSNSNFPVNLDSQQQKKLKGRNLAKQDRDLKMINSGPLGTKRLVMNKALDLQEAYPDLSDNDAQKMALGYCILNYGSN